MIKNSIGSLPLLLAATVIFAVGPSTSYAQTCVPGRIATGVYDPRPYYPTDEDLEEYLPDDPDDPSDPVDPGDPGGDPVDPLPPSDCTLAWSPDIGEFCNSTQGRLPPGITGPTDRISCGEDDSMVISEYQGYPLSLINVTSALPNPLQSANTIQVSTQFYFPPNFDFTAGRLPLGIKVGTGNASGGSLASEQTASSVRLSVTNDGTLGLYSYHLDRNTPIVDTPGGYGGAPGRNQFGKPARMQTPIPKGEWITVVMEMTLGNGSWGQDSSAVYMYNSAGELIGSTGFSDVTYKLDDWEFTAMFSDTKQNNSTPVSQNQSFIVKNYQGYACNT